jgi:Na+(H+)/acetate symporter ActP
MKAVRTFFERHSGRDEYRRASITLIGVGILAILFLFAAEPTRADVAFAFLIMLSAYLALAILTYFRLRNASRSAWWLILMGLTFPIGPVWIVRSWEWGGIAIAPSGLIALLPVIIGWFAIGRQAK